MNKKTIVCFGDSNTHGYRSFDSGRYDKATRWPGVLQELLGPDYDICEEGLNGRTWSFEDPIGEGLCGAKLIKPVLLTHEPVDLLIIMLGTNDTKQRFAATPANIRTGAEGVLRSVLNLPDAFRNRKPNILVICPPPIDPRYEDAALYGEMGEGCVEKSRAIAPLLELTCRALGIHFIDAAALPGVDMGPTDWMHLTPEAHRHLAEELAVRIPELL